MKNNLFILITILLLSCNRKNNLFEGIRLGITKVEFDILVKQSKKIDKDNRFVADKYFGVIETRDYRYNLSGYHYLFNVDFVDDALCVIKGNLCFNEEPTNMGIINYNTLSSGIIKEISSNLSNNYGKYTIDSTSVDYLNDNKGERYIYKWVHDNAEIRLYFGRYENTILAYNIKNSNK